MKKKKTAVEEKKEINTCQPNGCPFFSMDPEIFEDKIIDGVRQRKVRRVCLYDLSAINSWAKICPWKVKQKQLREGKYEFNDEE